ncbi:MAG: 30S ribosomal protein S7, partial [Candidatus Promineifilaceae bacterium]
MPRRYRPERREVEPDLRYNSRRVSMFVNRMMRGGKKSTALGIIYDCFDLIEDRTKRSPLEVFEQAMQNATPQVEVKPRRVGGATYQVPMEVPHYRQTTLAIRWLLAA